MFSGKLCVLRAVGGCCLLITHFRDAEVILSKASATSFGSFNENRHRNILCCIDTPTGLSEKAKDPLEPLHNRTSEHVQRQVVRSTGLGVGTG
jgi:hypothetical protein